MVTSTAALVVSIISLLVSGFANLAFVVWRHRVEAADKARQTSADRYARYAADAQKVGTACGIGRT